VGGPDYSINHGEDCLPVHFGHGYNSVTRKQMIDGANIGYVARRMCRKMQLVFY
jgi:hypothetical protein